MLGPMRWLTGWPPKEDKHAGVAFFVFLFALSFMYVC